MWRTRGCRGLRPTEANIRLLFIAKCGFESFRGECILMYTKGDIAAAYIWKIKSAPEELEERRFASYIPPWQIPLLCNSSTLSSKTLINPTIPSKLTGKGISKSIISEKFDPRGSIPRQRYWRPFGGWVWRNATCNLSSLFNIFISELSRVLSSCRRTLRARYRWQLLNHHSDISKDQQFMKFNNCKYTDKSFASQTVEYEPWPIFPTIVKEHVVVLCCWRRSWPLRISSCIMGQRPPSSYLSNDSQFIPLGSFEYQPDPGSNRVTLTGCRLALDGSMCVIVWGG